VLLVSAESFAGAVSANGAAVEQNLAAFRAGRQHVVEGMQPGSPPRPGALHRHYDDDAQRRGAELAARRGLGGVPARRAAALIAYQGVKLAERYLDLVRDVHTAETDGAGPQTPVADQVAEAFFKLLAYKDEYEVARLHLLPEFRAALAAAVPGGERPRVLLHPPVLRAMGMRRKLALPAGVATPAFRTLRAMRRVRGTPFDPFGHTAVRRTERRLARQYEDDIRALLPRLASGGRTEFAEFAALPLEIRGYETIKLAGVKRYEQRRATLLAALGAVSADARSGTERS
jgi:indolepyruvate ferredoxin oxidoreductase